MKVTFGKWMFLSVNREGHPLFRVLHPSATQTQPSATCLKVTPVGGRGMSVTPNALRPTAISCSGAWQPEHCSRISRAVGVASDATRARCSTPADPGPITEPL